MVARSHAAGGAPVRAGAGGGGGEASPVFSDFWISSGLLDHAWLLANKKAHATVDFLKLFFCEGGYINFKLVLSEHRIFKSKNLTGQTTLLSLTL